MSRSRGAERHEITRICVRLRTSVHQIDIHLGEEIVLLLLAWRKEELLSDRHVIGSALAFDAAIGFATQPELIELWLVWLVDDCADWRLVFGIDNHALVALGDLIQQHHFGNATAAIS